MDIGVEERIIDLCLENDSLKRKIETIEIILSKITERDIVIDKTLKVLVKDFRERKDPSVEEIVRCMYG